MNPASVVLLAGPDPVGSVTCNFLSRELVIREQQVSRLELVRGRLRRYGPFIVLGQILFCLLVNSGRRAKALCGIFPAG